MSSGITSDLEYANGKNLYGPCQISIPYKGVLTILFEAMLTPFYVFQILSIFLWIFEKYYSYTIAIVVMTAASVMSEVLETRRNILSLRSMAKNECQMNVYRGSDVEDACFFNMNSINLIPGDIIEIPEGVSLPCDCVLLTGSVIVNEGLLTGESLQTIKFALPVTNNIYDPDKDKKHTLYAGTEVVKTKPYGESRVVALVLRTGFNTAKGELLRYSLLPKPLKFSIASDAYKYIAVMFSLSIVGMIIQLFNGETDPIDLTVSKCLDLITVLVPPALPACMSIGITFALSRLKKKQIYCVSPSGINVAGKVNTMCFDKTGTLTEEGLDILGYRLIETDIQGEPKFSYLRTTLSDIIPESILTNDEVFEKVKSSLKIRFVECLASCQDLSRLNGKLIGDRLEIEMFKSTGWILEDAVGNEEEMVSTYVMPAKVQQQKEKLDPYQLGIVKRFEFTPDIQRMRSLSTTLKLPSSIYLPKDLLRKS